jgi:hypothetical protein
MALTCCPIYKPELILAALLAFSPAGLAGTTNSAIVRGIRAEVFLDKEESISSDQPIVYWLVCTNAAGATVFYPRPDYLARVSLSKDKGQVLSATPLGQQLGSKFTELTNYSFEKIEKRIGGSSAGAPKIGRLRTNAGASERLPAPEKLFELSDPGRYTLKLELQVFEQVKSGTNYDYELVKFPPMNLAVVRSSSQPP